MIKKREMRLKQQLEDAELKKKKMERKQRDFEAQFDIEFLD